MGIRLANWLCSFWLVPSLLALPLAAPAFAESPRLPKVFASPSHGLIVLPSGAVKVFGKDNNSGQLGLGALGNPEYADNPVDLPGVYDAASGAAEGNYSLLLRADGTVLAWGENTAGQLGLGTPGVLPKSWEILQPVPKPTSIPGLSRVRQLAASGTFALALLEDGTVRAWGYCGNWKLDGVPGSGAEYGFRVPYPATVSGLTGVKAIAGGNGFALALTEDGTVKAWGGNSHGQIGDEKLSRSPSPITVAGIDNAVAISAGVRYALALLRDGTVRVWGSGGHEGSDFGGARGPSIHTGGSEPWTATPLAIPGLRNVVAISAGASGVALLVDGTVRAWGYNGFSSMGLGHGAEYPVGLQTPRVSNVAAISTGFNRTYFTQKDGTVLVSGVHRKNRGETFSVPTVILTKAEAAKPAPAPSARDIAPPPASVQPMPAGQGQVSQPAPAQQAPVRQETGAQPSAPPQPPPTSGESDALKQLNDTVNTLRSLKGLFGK